LVGDLRFSKSGSGGLGLEVNIAVVADDCLCLVWRQGHAAGLGEGIGASGCRHVVVLPLQIMGPVGHWHLRGIVTFGNSGGQIVIGGPLQAPPCAVLDNKLFILLIEADSLAVLCPHHAAPNSILVVVHAFMRGHVRCLEHPLLTSGGVLAFLFSEFSCDFIKDIGLQLLLLLANPGEVVGWVEARANR